MLEVFLAALLAAILGLAFLFYGYRLFLVMLPIWGFFAGFWLGAQGVNLLLGSGFLATTTGWVVGFVLGLITALLSYMFYLVGIALVAAGFGAAMGSGIMTALGFDPGILVSLVALVSAVIVAGLTLWLNLQKYIIILITALGGANLLLLAVLLLLGDVTLAGLAQSGSSLRFFIQGFLQGSWLWLVIWLTVAVAGFVVQLRTNRRYTFEKQQFVEGWG
jgi:hypothetical protein